jgi:hypothetical protein
MHSSSVKNPRSNSEEEEKEIEIPKSRNSLRTLESAQQQRGGGGGGDRNSQIKKFLKNIKNLGSCEEVEEEIEIPKSKNSSRTFYLDG